MSYYDEPYYCEPSEFDEKCKELIDMLRESANEDIKDELERLRKENAEMKDIVNNYNKKVEELENAKRKYEFDERVLRHKIEGEVKKLRLSKMLEGFETTLYTVSNVGKEKPKCDKCDKDRYIHYFTPRGREQTELCECKVKSDFYVVEEAYCSEFSIQKNGDNAGQIVGWYKLKSSNEDDYYVSATYAPNKIYKGQNFADLNPNGIYFYDIETAQQYADWLNKENNNAE